MKTLLPVAIMLCGLSAAVDSAFAQTWIQQTNAPSTNWVSVASSADGTKLVAVNLILPSPASPQSSPIFISTNSGGTWLPSNDTGYGNTWHWVASSADGIKLVAAIGDGPLNISTNSGIDWMPSGSFSMSDFVGWQGISSSADGSDLVAIGGWGVYKSVNSGMTWNATSTPSDNLTCVASSADGTKIIVGTLINDTVYVSTNSGTNWKSTGLTNCLQWGSVASSADGSKLVAAVYANSVVYTNGNYINLGGPIYTSADSGNTWTQATNAPYLNWQSVASSADGKKLVAASNGGQIYSSTNSGTTWIPANAPSTNWQCVAMSADGNEMVAVSTSDGIWTSQTSPSPQLNISKLSSNLSFSWLIPSTNFVLQQSPDLISWSSVTDTPALNFTNLQYQVTLPPTNSSGFFRLISQ